MQELSADDDKSVAMVEVEEIGPTMYQLLTPSELHYNFQEDEKHHPETKRLRCKWYCWQAMGCSVPMNRQLREEDLLSSGNQCNECRDREKAFRTLSDPTAAAVVVVVSEDEQVLQMVRPNLFTTRMTCDQKLVARNYRLERMQKLNKKI